MPRLWNETLEGHHRAVHEAILDATWALMQEHGMTAVTMSQIATKAGIGRATLYKYFPDAEAILMAWHERHITGHLEQLAALSEDSGSATDRLASVLEAYALISYRREHQGNELAAMLHRGEHVVRAQQQLVDLVRGLIAGVVAEGGARDDVDPDELARYCLHALTAADRLPSEAAVRRLVEVTLSGLRPPR